MLPGGKFRGFYDGFEDGLKKWEYGMPGGSAVESIGVAHVKSGGISYKVLTGGVYPGNGYALHYMGAYNVARVGVECSFSFHHAASLITFGLNLDDKIHHYITGVRYNHANTKLEYINSTGNWTDLLTDFTLNSNRNYFSTLKFVVDFPNEKYVRCIVNATEIDMSTYSIRDTEIPGYGGISSKIQCENGDIANYEFYFDDYIITINEP
ncbi:hypothetical protein ES708_29628 [subsurface metagenome]